MRLLSRTNTHRDLGACTFELASSPDTAGRERWRWHLHLVRGASEDLGSASEHAASFVARDSLPLGSDRSGWKLLVEFDSLEVKATLDLVPLDTGQVVSRNLEQLVIIVVARGRVVAEGRHDLRRFDVLVLSGDDPFDISLEPVPGEVASVAIARIGYVDGTEIAWVP